MRIIHIPTQIASGNFGFIRDFLRVSRPGAGRPALAKPLIAERLPVGAEYAHHLLDGRLLVVQELEARIRQQATEIELRERGHLVHPREPVGLPLHDAVVQAGDQDEVGQIGYRAGITHPMAPAAGDVDHVRLEIPLLQQHLPDLRCVAVDHALHLCRVVELVLESVEDVQDRQHADVL